MTYYDGTKLLNMKAQGNVDPSIYICTSNRSAGKTFYFTNFLLNNWLNDKQQFVYLVRYKDDLSSTGEMFFSAIGFKYPQYSIKTQVVSQKYANIYLIDNSTNDKFLIGYGMAINTSSQLRRYSGQFVDVTYLYFDEFQEEFGGYVKDEVTKLMSLYQTVARGDGKQLRDVKLILSSNDITIFNPYYTALNVNKYLKTDSKFVRGTYWVLEKNTNTEINNSIDSNCFLNAFKKTQQQYIQYAKGECSLFGPSTKFVLDVNLNNYRYIYNLYVGGDLLGLYYGCDSFHITKKSIDKTKAPRALDIRDVETNTPYSRFIYNLLKDSYGASKLTFGEAETAEKIIKLFI